MSWRSDRPAATAGGIAQDLPRRVDALHLLGVAPGVGMEDPGERPVRPPGSRGCRPTARPEARGTGRRGGWVARSEHHASTLHGAGPARSGRRLPRSWWTYAR